MMEGNNGARSPISFQCILPWAKFSSCMFQFNVVIQSSNINVMLNCDIFHNG